MTPIYDIYICIAAALNHFCMSKLNIKNCTYIYSEQQVLSESCELKRVSLTDVFCDIVWRCRDESSPSPAVVKCAPEHLT